MMFIMSDVKWGARVLRRSCRQANAERIQTLPYRDEVGICLVRLKVLNLPQSRTVHYFWVVVRSYQAP